MRRKLEYLETDFLQLRSGIFYMFHKKKKKVKFINYSLNLPKTLCEMVNNLYEKERCDLNPLEVELKYFSPSEENWVIQVWQYNREELLLERAKKIVQHQTLKPHGLNRSLKITSREMWEEFTQWYMSYKGTKQKKLK